MGRVQLFEIRLSQGRVVYSPGEPLAGAVHLRLGAPLPFRGGRGVPSGKWVDAFLPAVGRGSRKPGGQWARLCDCILRNPRVTTEPWVPGTGYSRRPTEGRAGQAARWPSSSASVPSCALRLGGQSLCEGLSACSLCPGNPGSRSVRAFSFPLFSFPRSAALCTCWAPTRNLVCSGSSLFLVSRLLYRSFFKDSSGPSVQGPSRIHRVPSCFQLKDCSCWQGALFHWAIPSLLS